MVHQYQYISLVSSFCGHGREEGEGGGGYGSRTVGRPITFYRPKFLFTDQATVISVQQRALRLMHRT